ncbi:hypothetical protein ACXXDK_08480 [Deinococcus sp. PESE-38]
MASDTLSLGGVGGAASTRFVPAGKPRVRASCASRTGSCACASASSWRLLLRLVWARFRSSWVATRASRRARAIWTLRSSSAT